MDRFVPQKAQKSLLANAVETLTLTNHPLPPLKRRCQLLTVTLVGRKRSFELMSWKHSGMQDRFVVAVVIHRIDNINTTVGHLSREVSHLLWHF